MADDLKQNGMIVPLRNVMSMVTLVQRVIDREPRLPGLAVFFGYSGFGKSTAMAYSANVFGAAHVEVRSTWTKKDLCLAILEELEIPAPKQLSKMVDLIGKQLGHSGQPLFIDEADRLITRNLLDLVRDIHDIAQTNTFRGAGANIIMVGEEELPTELSRTERFHGRIFDSVAAKEAAIEDVDHLAPRYAAGIGIEFELKDALLAASRHSIRRVCSNLAAVKECALMEGLTTVSKEAWDAYSEATGKQFSSGKPPRPRGLL
jgi:DNA transposition AAA+ family ATPase